MTAGYPIESIDTRDPANCATTCEATGDDANPLDPNHAEHAGPGRDEQDDD